MTSAHRNLLTADSRAAGALGEITTAVLAQQILGLRNARAARDWCQRHGVPYRRDGKLNWVRLADVRRVLDGLPLRCAPNEDRAREAAEAAVATMTGLR